MSENKVEFIPLPPDASKQVADELAFQLGSDQVDVERGRIDMRRFSYLTPRAQIPMAYIAMRGKNVPAYKQLYTLMLNLGVSKQGLGRKDIIRMEAASRSGGNVSVEESVKEPGWLERNITRRNWREEEMQRLRQ
jgi:hypothetical protein